MNYIHQLQGELNAALAQVESFKLSLDQLRSFLHSPKFIGTDSNGERKDWISTSDLIRLLWDMENTAYAKWEEVRTLHQQTINQKNP